MTLLEADLKIQPEDPRYSWNFTYRDTKGTTRKTTVIVPGRMGWMGVPFAFYAFKQIFSEVQSSNPQNIIERLNEITEGQAILFPDLEGALVGICTRFGRPPVALYDRKKCLEILMERFEEAEGEDAYQMAVEWFEYNTIGTWAGEYTPAFMDSGEV